MRAIGREPLNGFMNKYLLLIIAGVIILGGGAAYRSFLLPQKSIPVSTGRVRTVTITAKKDHWQFEPEAIDAQRGDKIVATIINEDNYDHGFAIDAFGISQRMPAGQTIKVEFVVTQEGDFPFYCSVPCGEGIVDGKKRTHFDMTGKIHVKGIARDAK